MTSLIFIRRSNSFLLNNSGVFKARAICIIIGSSFISFIKFYTIGMCSSYGLELAACRFAVRACALIRGPYFVHSLAMILSSRPMVCSWGPEAFLTSIVNFFISPLLLALALASLNTLSRFISTRTGEWFHKFIAPGNHQTRANYILSSLGLTVKLAACCL